YWISLLSHLFSFCREKKERGWEWELLPDHDLIVPAGNLMVRVRRREEIIRNIGADLVTLIPPLSLVGNAINLAHELLGRELAARVGVALDVILAAGPRPLAVPLDAVGADLADGGALLALT